MTSNCKLTHKCKKKKNLCICRFASFGRYSAVTGLSDLPPLSSQADHHSKASAGFLRWHLVGQLANHKKANCSTVEPWRLQVGKLRETEKVLFSGQLKQTLFTIGKVIKENKMNVLNLWTWTTWEMIWERLVHQKRGTNVKVAFLWWNLLSEMLTVWVRIVYCKRQITSEGNTVAGLMLRWRAENLAVTRLEATCSNQPVTFETKLKKSQRSASGTFLFARPRSI